MRKIIILVPVYNDWTSLQKLIYEINNDIEEIKDVLFEFIVINDASTINQPNLIKPKNIKSFKVLNMTKNKGHARCNAFGIRYINKYLKFDNIILMDGDGEDRPVEIKNLVEKIKKNPKNSVVAKRIKRSEGAIFQFLYSSHKILTYLFTGKKINFGNYSCLTKLDVEKLSSKPSLWSSYSGTVKKYLKDLSEIDSTRGVRYFGPSQMSFFKLLIHSLSIIAVFKYQVFLRSALLLIILFYLNLYLNIIVLPAKLLIIFFNLIVFIVSLREKKEDLLKSHENLKNINEIFH